MLIIAIDLGKFNSVACLYNTQTQKHQFETLATDRGFFETLFKTYTPDLVVVEACGPNGWVSDLCAELSLEIIVCSTHEDAWMFKNVKRKTDKDDAIKLARLVSRLGLLAGLPTRTAAGPDANHSVQSMRQRHGVGRILRSAFDFLGDLIESWFVLPSVRCFRC